MKELLEGRIKQDFSDYIDLEAIIKEKQKELEKNKSDIVSGAAGNVDDIEKRIKFYQNFYIDLTLFMSDLKVIFSRLFFNIDLHKDLNYDGLPTEIVEFYNANRTFAPRQMFVVKDGKISEKEEGSLEKERQNFLQSDFLKGLIDKVK